VTIAAALALVLAAEPAAAADPRPLAPLACPAGAERKGGPPPELHEEWCEGKDPGGRPRREGPARTYYDDGGLWVEETFREGLRDGPFVERHRNGRTAREGTFAAGWKSGPWKVHFESGAPEEESEWREGVPHGRYVSYWRGGGKRTEGRHCGGVQCGTWRTWDEGGRLLGEMDHGEPSVRP
jgi:antitoxin component YwqK of YwqJK toxin-antitoxin module